MGWLGRCVVLGAALSLTACTDSALGDCRDAWAEIEDEVSRAREQVHETLRALDEPDQISETSSWDDVLAEMHRLVAKLEDAERRLDRAEVIASLHAGTVYECRD
jgi:hypothetical protein